MIKLGEDVNTASALVHELLAEARIELYEVRRYCPGEGFQ
jgi:hypothetical protein